MLYSSQPDQRPPFTLRPWRPRHHLLHNAMLRRAFSPPASSPCILAGRAAPGSAALSTARAQLLTTANVKSPSTATLPAGFPLVSTETRATGHALAAVTRLRWQWWKRTVHVTLALHLADPELLLEGCDAHLHDLAARARANCGSARQQRGLESSTARSPPFEIPTQWARAINTPARRLGPAACAT